MPNAYWGGFIATNHWPVCSCHCRFPLVVKHRWQQLVRGWHHQIPQQNPPPHKKKNLRDQIMKKYSESAPWSPVVFFYHQSALKIPSFWSRRGPNNLAPTHTHTHLSTNPTKDRVLFSWLANQKQKYYHRDSITEATAAATLDSTTQQQQLKWSEAKSMGKTNAGDQRAAE